MGRSRLTMGCADKCPYVQGTRYVDWELPDPKGLPIDAVRGIRDAMAGRVRTLVGELG